MDVIRGAAVVPGECHRLSLESLGSYERPDPRPRHRFLRRRERITHGRRVWGRSGSPSRGPATDKGEAMRGLAELPWRPFAFGEASPLTWESAGNEELRVCFANARTRAAVLFEVDSAGRVQSALAPDRPRIVDGKVAETAWSGVFDDYRTFSGIRVPTFAQAAWLLPEGPFTYWRGRVSAFRVLL